MNALSSSADVWPRRGYIPTLDGWRTLSIIAVMGCHDRLHEFGRFNTLWIYDHGNIGVDIFFAISGLLICSRLLEDENRRGSISLKVFYIRRAFRILPPALTYLAALAFLAVTIELPVRLPEILAAIFFVHNYSSLYMPFQSVFPGYTAHFWSLAVEEHFYLFLPALLVFAPRKNRSAWLFTLAAAVGLLRFIMGPTGIRYGMQHTEVRLDELLVPAAFAILLTNRGFRDRLIPWLALWPILAAGILFVVITNPAPRLQPLLLAWGLPFLVMGTMLRPQSWFSRFLELPVMRYFGRLSYSLYLWQALFFVAHLGTQFPRIRVLQQWPLCLVMTIGCAMLSYYLIERPAIRFGHRLSDKVSEQRLIHS